MGAARYLAGMEVVRWGIVSTGKIAHKFARDFRFVEEGELVAVASRTEGAARRFAEEFKIPSAHASYEALFHDDRVDAVYVATPHTLHASNTIDAIRAGKHVLCEKPITTAPDDCRALFDRAADTGKFLMEALWTYFLPAVRRAKAWVDTGRIGAIKHVKADFGYPVDFDPESRLYAPPLGGGAVLDMGLYPIAIAWLFLAQDPSEVHAFVRRAPTGVDDDVVMVFNYPDAVATLATSFRCRLQNAAYIIGEEGYIAIPEFWRARSCILYRLDKEVDRFEDDRESLGYDFETRAAIQDIRAGKSQSDVVPWSTSLKIQEHMARVLKHL